MQPLRITLLALALVATGLIAPAAQAQDAEEGVMTITNPHDGTAIDILVCKPDGANAANPAPVILESHGWGGSRQSSCNGVASWLADGFGVVSISMRGFGASGGQAHVHDPDYEGQDLIAIIDKIASFSWVELEGPNDPVMGAIGGSYGGGYQFLSALQETALYGEPRLDALAPEITWYDLVESLAPQGVVRSAWVTALYAAGAPSVHPGIHQAFAYGVATGNFPGPDAAPIYDVETDFAGNGPSGWVAQGTHLNIPVLFNQGETDNLFNLNQGWKNMEITLTPEARAQSVFIGFLGGHALPTVHPIGMGGSGNPCADPYGGFGSLSRAWFRHHLMNSNEDLPSAGYHMATQGGDCVNTASLDATTTVDAGDILASTSSAGPIQQIALAQGPLTLSGIPTLDATVTSLSALDARAFFGLSIGTTPADARVIAHNMMPLRAQGIIIEQSTHIELPGLAITIPAGQTLYLTTTPTNDMYFAHSARTPGAMLLQNTQVNLPIVN